MTLEKQKRTSENQGFSLSDLFTLVMGVGLLIAAYVMHMKEETFYATAQTAIGTEVEVQETGWDEKKPVYLPIIQFDASDGEVYTVTTVTSQVMVPKYQVGERVDVLYDPAYPTEAVLASDEFRVVKLIIVILAVIGASLVVISVVPLFKNGLGG